MLTLCFICDIALLRFLTGESVNRYLEMSEGFIKDSVPDTSTIIHGS